VHTDNQTKESLFNKMVSEGPQGTYDLKVSLYGSTFSIELNVKKAMFKNWAWTYTGTDAHKLYLVGKEINTIFKISCKNMVMSVDFFHKICLIELSWKFMFSSYEYFWTKGTFHGLFTDISTQNSYTKNTFAINFL